MILEFKNAKLNQLDDYLAHSINGIQIVQNGTTQSISNLNEFKFGYMEGNLFITQKDKLQLLIPNINNWIIHNNGNHMELFDKDNNTIFIKKKT